MTMHSKVGSLNEFQCLDRMFIIRINEKLMTLCVCSKHKYKDSRRERDNFDTKEQCDELNRLAGTGQAPIQDQANERDTWQRLTRPSGHTHARSFNKRH